MFKLVKEQKQSEKRQKFGLRIKRRNRKLSTIKGILDDSDKSKQFHNLNKYKSDSSVKSKLPYCLNLNKYELGEFTS